MPCKTCHELFNITPCEHPTGIFTEGLFKINYRGDANIPHYYPVLKEKCPCKECLIKTICLEGDKCRVGIYIDNVYIEFYTPTRRFHKEHSHAM
jgi:hypothetical protein